MIRPVAMSNPVQFKGYTITGGEPDKEEKNITEEPKKKSGFTNNERNIFIAGAFLGAVMGIGGTILGDKTQMKSMMTDMQEEFVYGVDSMIVEDATDDKIPDVILVGKDGISTVYDMHNNKVFFDMQGDRIEKIHP